MMRWLSLFLSLLIAGAAAQARTDLPWGGLSAAGLPIVPGGALPGAVPPGAGFPAAGLPGGVTGLPGRLMPDVDRDVRGSGARIDARRLETARLRGIAALIRRYPRLIERDPHGAAIVRGEIVAIAPSDAALARARAAGFAVARDESLGALGVRIAVLRAPVGLSTQRALAELRALDPVGTYDFDHLYAESGASDPANRAGESASAEHASATASAGRSAMMGPAASAVVRAGLIDGGVDGAHPVFHDVAVYRHGCKGVVVPSDHGTEVASLLVGRARRFHGAAPGAELFAADVYCGQPTGGAIDAIADAFDWLLRERVPVINVSLVGPPNALLAAVVRSVIAHGSILVAAVGNDGPAAPPLYPAAYPGVVGVTAVDAHRRVLMEAERGSQVRFAAPGADMAAAVPPRAYAEVRGTSFAAPIVAGLLARELGAPGSAQAKRAIVGLEREAIDLGAPGVDPVYGYGLVGAQLGPDPALARSR